MCLETVMNPFEPSPGAGEPLGSACLSWSPDFRVLGFGSLIVARLLQSDELQVEPFNPFSTLARSKEMTTSITPHSYLRNSKPLTALFTPT